VEHHLPRRRELHRAGVIAGGAGEIEGGLQPSEVAEGAGASYVEGLGRPEGLVGLGPVEPVKNSV
jgi:hypothetical protein